MIRNGAGPGLPSGRRGLGRHLALVGLLALLATAGVAGGVSDGTTATGNATAGLSLSATADVSGANATVDVVLTTGDARSVAPAVQVTGLPDGWRIVRAESPNGTWRRSTREWLWLGVDPGERRTATLVLRRTNASDGGTVRFRAEDADDSLAAANATLVPAVDGGGGWFGPRRLLALAVLAAVLLGVAYLVFGPSAGTDRQPPRRQ